MVDIFAAGGTFLISVDGFYQHGHENAIDDEAGRICCLHDRFAELLAELGDGGHGGVTGGDAPSDFDELYRWHRVEKVHAHHAFRAVGGRGDVGDGNGGRIAGEDGVGRTYVIELGKERTFEVFVFANGFNDHFGLSEVLQLYSGVNVS